jgi:hypothetical protein
MNARQFSTCALMIIALLHSAGEALAGTDEPTEADVKAAAVYNLPLFVEWPEEKLLTEDPFFNICLLGKVSYQRELSVLEELEIFQRPIQVNSANSAENYSSCALMVVGDVTSAELKTTLPLLDEINVLTVGDQTNGAENGLIINLRIYEGLLKIDLNIAAARRAKIVIRSQLLDIANIVEDQVEKQQVEVSP